MPLPFADIKTSSIRRIAQKCSNGAAFAQVVNDGTRRLLRRGDWENVDIPIFVCVRNGCVVWPRYVGHVRKINYCCQPMLVDNMWYQFMPSNDRFTRDQWLGWRGDASRMTIDGTTPVYQDIMGEGRLVRAYARCPIDYGKTIQIFGTDNNGQPLHTQNLDGTFTNGITLILQAPFASSAVYVRHIDYVIKQQTQCIVDMYAYNASTNLLEDLAHYDPSETNPSYQKTKVNIAWSNIGTCSQAPNCCGTVRGVLAMVKLKFIPVQADTDLCIIDNLDALKLIVQAIGFEEAGDRANARQYESDAVEVLNRGLEDMIPDYQFKATVNILGTETKANQMF